jgi:hypothetical protein
LAEALKVNTTLHAISLSDTACGFNAQNKAALGVSTYEAFSAMLRVNTDLTVNAPPFNDTVASRNQMRIEQGLNNVGRGRLLSSSQTTREAWVGALDELNSNNVDESPEFNVSCLYSLLRMHPATCM